MSKLLSLGENDPFNYFPIADGLKPSTVGLKKLPAYPELEKNNVFQIDEKFAEYRRAKIVAREERLDKYYRNTGKKDLGPIVRYVIEALLREHPQHFEFKGGLFSSRLTGDEFAVDSNFSLIDQKTDLTVKFIDSFDAVAMQVPEDLVVHSMDGENDFSAAIHLFHPNGWSAEGMIDKSFQIIHEGVPRMDKITPKPVQMVRGLINGPNVLERIAAISFRTDTYLNRHPDVPDHLRHKAFSLTENPNLFMRFERQTTKGFPEVQSFLFTIKTYFVDCDQRGKDEEKLQKVKKVFEENNPLVYSTNFINNNKEAVLAWLNSKKD